LYRIERSEASVAKQAACETQPQGAFTLPELTYSISQEIFDQYPGYTRGVVLAFEVHNGPSPARLIQMLRDAEEFFCRLG
jgi:hypothetical protein